MIKSDRNLANSVQWRVAAGQSNICCTESKFHYPQTTFAARHGFYGTAFDWGEGDDGVWRLL